MKEKIIVKDVETASWKLVFNLVQLMETYCNSLSCDAVSAWIFYAFPSPPIAGRKLLLFDFMIEIIWRKLYTCILREKITVCKDLVVFF